MIPCWAWSATTEVCWVLTTMPGLTSMAQEAWGLGILRMVPSRSGVATSTRHCRQAPAGLRRGWSQKRGISMPAASAARMMRVPLGTRTSTPSMVTVRSSVASDPGRTAVIGHLPH